MAGRLGTSGRLLLICGLNGATCGPERNDLLQQSSDFSDPRAPVPLLHPQGRSASVTIPSGEVKLNRGFTLAADA